MDALLQTQSRLVVATMKRIVRGILIGGLVTVLASIPVLAVYYVYLEVTESNGTSYTNLPLFTGMNVTYLVDNAYIAANGTDTRVTNTEYSSLPHMLADDRLLWVGDVAGNDKTQFIFWTGQEPVSQFPIIMGYGGYVTVSDNPLLEPGDVYMFEFIGYLDMSAGSGKSLIWKAGAISFNRTGTDELTYSVVGGYSLVASSVASGDHTVIVYSDGTDMWITVDGTLKDTIATSSVPDTDDDWVLFQNNIAPYVYYFDEWIVVM